MRSFLLWLSHRRLHAPRQQAQVSNAHFHSNRVCRRSLSSKIPIAVCFIPPKQRQADLTSLAASAQQSAPRVGQKLRDGRIYELGFTFFSLSTRSPFFPHLLIWSPCQLYARLPVWRLTLATQGLGSVFLFSLDFSSGGQVLRWGYSVKEGTYKSNSSLQRKSAQTSSRKGILVQSVGTTNLKGAWSRPLLKALHKGRIDNNHGHYPLKDWEVFSSSTYINLIDAKVLLKEY